MLLRALHGNVTFLEVASFDRPSVPTSLLQDITGVHLAVLLITDIITAHERA